MADAAVISGYKLNSYKDSLDARANTVYVENNGELEILDSSDEKNGNIITITMTLSEFRKINFLKQ